MKFLTSLLLVACARTAYGAWFMCPDLPTYSVPQEVLCRTWYAHCYSTLANILQAGGDCLTNTYSLNGTANIVNCKLAGLTPIVMSPLVSEGYIEREDEEDNGKYTLFLKSPMGSGYIHFSHYIIGVVDDGEGGYCVIFWSCKWGISSVWSFCSKSHYEDCTCVENNLAEKFAEIHELGGPEHSKCKIRDNSECKYDWLD